MWKRVVHIEFDENTIPTSDKTTLTTFAQTSDRFQRRKNTQGRRNLVSRARTINAPFSQTQSHFYKNTSWANNKQSSTQASFRRTSKSVDSGCLMGRLPLGAHSLGFHSERYGSNRQETAKRNIFRKIQTHNQKMFSKMYSLGKEEIGLNNKSLPFQNCYPSNPPQFNVKLQEKTTPKSKERKVSRGTSEWIRYKKWETKHQGLKKFMKNQAIGKAKAPQREFNPWQTSQQLDEADY